MPQEDRKEITLNNVTYTIVKMTPRDGNYWFSKLIGSMKGAIINQTLEGVVDSISSFLDKMDKKQFGELQGDCLKYVYFPTPSGSSRAVDTSGNWLLPDQFGPTTFALTTHALMFTLMDFFGESFLTEIVSVVMPFLADSSPSSQEAPSAPLNTPESMNGSFSPSVSGIGDNVNFGTALIP